MDLINQMYQIYENEYKKMKALTIQRMNDNLMSSQKFIIDRRSNKIYSHLEINDKFIVQGKNVLNKSGKTSEVSRELFALSDNYTSSFFELIDIEKSNLAEDGTKYKIYEIDEFDDILRDYDEYLIVRLFGRNLTPSHPKLDRTPSISNHYDTIEISSEDCSNKFNVRVRDLLSAIDNIPSGMKLNLLHNGNIIRDISIKVDKPYLIIEEVKNG